MKRQGKRLLLTLWRVLPLPGWLRRLFLRATCANLLVGVSALILDDQGRLLLLDHTYRRSVTWGMPGGYLGRGESLEEGLRREVREETGLEVQVGELLAAELTNHHELDLIYHCRVVGGRLRLSLETRAAAYRPLDELGDVLPNQRAMLAKIQASGRLAQLSGTPR